MTAPSNQGREKKEKKKRKEEEGRDNGPRGDEEKGEKKKGDLEGNGRTGKCPDKDNLVGWGCTTSRPGGLAGRGTAPRCGYVWVGGKMMMGEMGTPLSSRAPPLGYGLGTRFLGMLTPTRR